jgi:hypothetical protein
VQGGLRRADAGCWPGRCELRQGAGRAEASGCKVLAGLKPVVGHRRRVEESAGRVRAGPRQGAFSAGRAEASVRRSELVGRRLRRRGGDCADCAGGAATAPGARRAEAGCGADRSAQEAGCRAS